MIAVRRVGPADVEAWARLRVGLMESEGLLNRGLTPEELAAAIAAWLRERPDSRTFGAFVAELDGRLVGSGGISLYENPPGPGMSTRDAYVMSMFTEPEYRGRGVAHAVMVALLEFAREAGNVGRVWLHASPMGRPVYLREGFSPRDSYMQLRLDR